MKNDPYWQACMLVLSGLLGLLVAISACGSSPKAAEPLVEHSAGDLEYDRSGLLPVVTGTVIEASTGRFLAGVQVEGPDGQKTSTNAEGYFELRGLSYGNKCIIKATSESGLKGENRLRTLQAGLLEVVIYLR